MSRNLPFEESNNLEKEQGKMIRAKYVMCKRTAVLKNTTGREVVYKMMASGCPGIPVVNEQSEVVGIVSMCDILKAAKEKGPGIDKITAEQIMSKTPITADSDTSLDDLAKIMFENNYSVIPIVKGKKLVGIVSAREIIDTYVEPHLYSTFEE
jgi:acetoin utilization protein AcuB